MTDQEIRLQFGEMNAGEMRLARALVAWHEREITKLKEELTYAERWRDKLDTKLTEVVEAAERAGWDGVENCKNLPTFITYLADALSKAQAELTAASPGQQEAIDAAILLTKCETLQAALAESERQFQDKVYEIAALKAERDKAQGILKACLSVMPFGNIETHTVENLPGRIADLASELAAIGSENERLEAELAALRQPTQSAQPLLADDGRSLGQVAMKASFDADTDGLTVDECYEAAAQTVAAVVLAQAIRRMENVPVEEVADIIRRQWLNHGGWIEPAADALRARLIQAAKNQAVAVNEPAPDERQPDLSGESEKQVEADPYARLKAYAKAGARIRCGENEDWSNGYHWNWNSPVDCYEVHPDDLHFCPEYAQPWTPTVGQTVRLKSGGPVMTVTHVDPKALMCAWMNAQHELQVEPITTLCLIPATP